MAAIADLVKQTRFTCAADLETPLQHHLSIYNRYILQRSLNHQSLHSGVADLAQGKTRTLRQASL